MHKDSARCLPALALLTTVTLLSASGCSTAPAAGDRKSFLVEAQAATDWFKANVNGLGDQLGTSTGYVVFPSVGQWGIVFGGGEFGRGVLCSPDGEAVGWAAVNTASVGLQAGVQGFKMLLVFEDDDTLQRFKEDRLTGGVTGVVVAGQEGGSGTAPFEYGVAMYQGANSGLMAGVNVGLNYLRYEPR